MNIMKPSRPGRRGLILLSLCALFLSVGANIAFQDTKPVSQLSVEEIEEQLQECYLVKALSADKLQNAPETTSMTAKLFAVLFPSASPAINALLATAYISGPPNFLLALCPPNIDPSSLTIMVAFAVGGLLGDTLFHLLPEIFLGEDHHDKVRFVLLEPNRNLLLGVGIMVGFVTFVAMDKALRIATGGDGGHSHDHGHAQKPPPPPVKEAELEPVSSSFSGSNRVTANGELRKRKASLQSDSSSVIPQPPPDSSSPTTTTPANPSVKLAGLLNLIADFTHNITDGLALSSSFYASPTLGATTTVAVFFHEIPHEVGDFALLIQSGFSKRKAMGAQFVTAAGAFLGTFIGILVQEQGSGGALDQSAAGLPMKGIWGTSLQWGDMLLPFTAGTFLYVGTVAVIPELLETGPKKIDELKKTALQFLAMALGAGIMLAISWS